MTRGQVSQTGVNALIPLLDLKVQYASIREEVLVAVERVLESQRFILGPEVEGFEREFAVYCGCEAAVGVSSGSDALLVSLMAIGLRPGDEVITTPYTFFATAGAIARLGAKPVFVDIDPISYNIDPAGIEPVITPRTRAIVPVHLYGQMAEMDPVMDIAGDHGLYVIEDAAQAIGAEYKGKRAGSVGHLGCFSFFPSKNLGGFGDGGMVTTNDAELADRVRMLRSHGSGDKYRIKEIGGNFRLDALQAAVLRVKLGHLDEWTEARRGNALAYRTLFEGVGLGASSQLLKRSEDGVPSRGTRSDMTLPVELPDRRHVYNQFVVRSARRDALRAYLTERRIGSEIYYPVPLHLQESFGDLGHKAGAFPASESAAHETLAVPIYPELTDEMVATVVGAISDFIARETV